MGLVRAIRSPLFILHDSNGMVVRRHVDYRDLGHFFTPRGPTAVEICQDANKSAIVLSAKAYVTSAVSCAVDYVAETPSSKGPIHSARLQCSNKAGQSPKKVANLIIRPGDTNQISVGPAFDSLKPYQRCSASGEAHRP